MKVKIELQNKLFEKYPDLFYQKNLDMTRTCMCWGVDTGDGWYDILDKMCAAIVAHQKHKKDLPVSFAQIKEKFGGLRAYFDGGDDYVEGVVDMAERMSYVTCETCGAPGKERGTGWINTYCDACNKEKIKHWAEVTKDVKAKKDLLEENKAE
jgi:hypothetical protein